MAVLVATLVATGFVGAANEIVGVTDKIITSLYNADNTMRRMENTLVTSSGTMFQASQDLDRLREIADKLGTSLEASAVPFAKFASSATALTKEMKFEVFEGFSTALAGIHAEGRTVTGTFLALQQIMSKGKITMQDLRRQLSEHIPGAMQMAVKAYGDGTASQEEFNAAVRAGEVDTTEWITKFAALMKDKFGPAAEAAALTLKASLERMDNAWIVSMKNVGNHDQAIQTWTKTVDGVTESFISNTKIQESFAKVVGSSSRIVNNVLESVTPLLKFVALSVGYFAEEIEKVVAAHKLVGATLTLDSESIGKHWDTITGKAAEYRTEIAKMKDKHIFSEIDKKSMEDYADYIDKVLEKEQSVKDTRIKLVEDTFEATGQLSAEYFNNEKLKLEQQARNWHEAGLSVDQANQWFFNEVIKLNEKIKESTDKVVGGYNNITDSINEAIQKTLEWNALAFAEESASGVGVNVGGDEARWIDDRWVTEDGSGIQTGADTNSSQAATINNFFNQSISPSDASTVSTMQILEQSRY